MSSPQAPSTEGDGRGRVKMQPIQFPESPPQVNTSPYLMQSQAPPGQPARMNSPQPGPSWQPPPSSPSAPSPQSGGGQCRRVKVQPRLCTSEELRQQVEFTQKQIDMSKEALATQEKRTKDEIKKTEEATAAQNKEVEKVTAEVGQLNTQIEQLTTEVAEKEAKLTTFSKANQLLAMHMREEIVELSQAAEVERVTTRQLSPQLNQINSSPVRGGQSVQQARPNSPQPGPSWQPQPSPMSPPPPSAPGDSRLGRVRMQPFQFPDEISDAARAPPNQVIPARMPTPPPGPSWQPPPSSPSAPSPQSGGGQCRRVKLQPRLCTSEELRQQVEFTQKQIDMSKEALATQEKRTKGEIKKTEEATAAQNKEIEKVTAEVGQLNTQVEQLTTEIAEKEAKLTTFSKANQLLAMHMREEIVELSQAAERERVTTRQLSPHLNQVNSSPVRGGQSIQQARPTSPQPGPSWQPQQPPLSPPPPSAPGDGRLGRVRMQPFQFPDEISDAAYAAPNQVIPVRMPSPPPGPSWAPPPAFPSSSPQRPSPPGVQSSQQGRPNTPEGPPRWVPPPLLPQSSSPPPPSPPGDGRCRRIKIQPRFCTSEELRQQVEFTQKQVEMTKEALATQEKRAKEEIKKTEEATAAKHQEIERVTAELGQLSSQVEALTTEVQGKEAELFTLHTANQIEAEHMREEIVELSESAERERMTREQLTPQLDQVVSALTSTPNQVSDLERQQQELQAEISYLRNSPGGACDFVPGTDMLNFELSNDMIEFETTPDFIQMSPNFENMIQLSPRTPQSLQGRPLNFVSPARPARDTPSPVQFGQGQGRSPSPPPQSPRSPNYYTNILLNPRPPTPPPLPTYDVQQWVGSSARPFPPRPRSAGPPSSNFPVSPPLQRSRTPPASSPPLPTMGGRNNATGQWYDEEYVENQNAQVPFSPPPPQPAFENVEQTRFPFPPVSSPRPRSAGPPSPNFPVSPPLQRSRTPPASSPPLPTMAGRNNAAGQWYDEEYVENQCALVPFPPSPPQPASEYVEETRFPFPPVSPPIQGSNFNATQFNSPPIQVGNPSNLGAYDFNIPTPPPFPNYNPTQYGPNQLQEPRPVSAPPQRIDQTPERPLRAASPQMQFPNYNYESPNATPQFRPPTPPPLPNYDVRQYGGAGNLRLRRNLRQRPQPPASQPPAQENAGVCGIDQGPNSPLGIGDMSGGAFGFEEVEGYNSPGLMAFSPPPQPRPATPPPIGPRDLDFVSRNLPGSNSPLVPPAPASCCRPGRSPSPPPNRRGPTYNQQQLSVCPVGPNVDGFCPCTHMAQGGPQGIGDISPPPGGFQDMSFSPNQNLPDVPDYLFTPPGGLQDVSGYSMNFEDVSMGSIPSPVGRNPNASPIFEGIMGEVPDFGGLGLDLSFSPIQNRGAGAPVCGIGNMSPPPGLPFQDMSFPSDFGSPAGIQNQSAPWLLEDGIQDISGFNYTGASNLSFSPIQNNRRAFGGERLDAMSPPPNFQDMSYSMAGSPAHGRINASSPIMDGIMGVVPDFEGLGLDVSFSPIRNRVQTPPSGGIGNISAPSGFQDMSFSGLGSPAPNQPLASTPTASPWGVGNGIDDVSFGGLGGADMSFSPIQRRGPGRRLQDFSPPPGFQDMSFETTPAGQGYGPDVDINARGGLRDQSPMRFPANLSFSPPADGGRFVAATPPPAVLSPTWRNQMTPPAYVEGEDMFNFSPPALMEMSDDFIQFSPRGGGFPPGQDLPFCELRGRDFNAPISPPLPRIRPPTPENAYTRPPPPSPSSPGGPLRTPPQPPPMPTYDLGRYNMTPGRRPNLPRPMYGNFVGPGLNDADNTPPPFQDMSFSPGRNEGPGPAAIHRLVFGPGLDEVSDMSMNVSDVSGGLPASPVRNPPRSPNNASPYLEGIMGVVPDFDGLGLDVSFSPIRNRVQTPPSCGIGNVSAPSGFLDMSYAGLGSPSPNQNGGPLASTPLSPGMSGGIQDVSYGDLGVGDMSFSPVQRRGPARRLQDFSPPPGFQDMSFETTPAGQGAGADMDINARGGLRDQSPMRFPANLSFSPPDDGGRVIAATPPPAVLSPTWRNQMTPPAYVEGEDMYNFSPPAFMEMSDDFIQFSPRRGAGFPPGQDLPFCEYRGRDFNAPLSPPLPRIRPATPENAYAPPAPPSPSSPGGPLRTPPRPPPMPTYDPARHLVRPGQRPNLPRPIHRNFEGPGLQDMGNTPPSFQDMSFSPERNPPPSPNAVERIVHGLNAPGIMEESGFSMNFEDMSMGSSPSPPSPGRNRSPVFDGIMGEDSYYGYDQGNMSFSPIRGRAPQQPPSPTGIANVSAPSFPDSPENSLGEYAMFASPPPRLPDGGPMVSTPLSAPWGMEGIREQSTFFNNGADMSFSPIVMNRGAHRRDQRIEDISPPVFQEISFGTPQAHLMEFVTPPRTNPNSPAMCARSR